MSNIKDLPLELPKISNNQMGEMSGKIISDLQELKMLDIKILPIELQKVAESELNEVPARIASDLQTLKTWIEQEPHLKSRMEDQFLVQFLRGCKYSLQKAKTKIDLFFTLKSKFPELFNITDVNETKFRKIYSQGFGMPLPQPLNDHGSRIFFMNFDADISKSLFSIEDLFRVVNAMHEIIIIDDSYACINGIVFVIDLKHITINMASKFTPSFLRKIVQFYEKSLPLRIKSVHIINTPVFFHAVVNILLPLLSEKLRRRFHVYGHDYSSMQKFVPTKYLPTCLEGENGSIDQLLKDFDKKWLQYKNYFEENVYYGTNEPLRPGKPIDFDSMYGLGGSFRKIDID